MNDAAAPAVGARGRADRYRSIRTRTDNWFGSAGAPAAPRIGGISNASTSSGAGMGLTVLAVPLVSCAPLPADDSDWYLTLRFVTKINCPPATANHPLT